MLKAVVYQMGDGIFTCYGASIKKNNALKKPIEKPVNEVRFYINEELSDSISVYKNINRRMCETFLNNFIKLVLMGVNPIDLSTISDKSNLIYDPNCHCNFGDPLFDIPTCKRHDPFERKHKRAFDNQKPEDFEEFFIDNTRNLNYRPIDDKFDKICNPKYNCEEKHLESDFFNECPHHNKFDRHLVLDHSGGPFPYPSHGEDLDIDFKKYNAPLTCLPVDRPPKCARQYHFYYGNGGFSMGGSVINDLEEISADALSTMLTNNNKPTFSNSKDLINVFNATRLDYLEIKTRQNDEWCFIMIPSVLTEQFEKRQYSWFYYDETEKKYVEFNTEEISSCISTQTNGVEYYITAVCPKAPMKVLLARRNDTRFKFKN